MDGYYSDDDLEEDDDDLSEHNRIKLSNIDGHSNDTVPESRLSGDNCSPSTDQENAAEDLT